MQKNHFLFSLALLILASFANAQCPWPLGKVATISTIKDLQNITLCTPTQGRTFQLVNDIDATGFPFQTISGGFDGTFDGNNFKISNLQVVPNGAIFDSFITTAVIKNLTLESLIIQGGDDPTYYHGGLVNLMMGAAQISNVSITSGTVTGETPSYLGGMVGRMISGGMNNCKASIALAPGQDAKYNAILVAWQQGGKIENSVSSGYITLTGNTEGNGGIVGLQSNGGLNESPVITRSLSTTIIVLRDAKTAFGNGVLAGAIGGELNNSYANGTIDKSNNNAMFISGGAVGYLMDGGKLDRIYSSSRFINGDSNSDGGLVGLAPFTHNDASCTNSYWDAQLSGLDGSAVCSDGGRDTEQMQPDGPDKNTFTNWNIQQENMPIWKFIKGQYPTLVPSI